MNEAVGLLKKSRHAANQGTKQNCINPYPADPNYKG